MISHRVQQRTLILRHSASIPIVTVDSTPQTPISDVDGFATFTFSSKCQVQIQVQTATTTLTLSKLLTCYDLITRRYTSHGAGDEICVVYVNNSINGDPEHMYAGSVMFSPLQPSHKFDKRPQLLVLKLDSDDVVTFNVDGQTYTHQQADENQQDFCINKFVYQLYRLRCPEDYEQLDEIQRVEFTRLVTLGHRGMGPNKDYAPFAAAQALTTTPRAHLAENSVLSYNTAFERCDGVEMDVILTADRVPVVNHDLVIEVGGLGKVPISSITLEQFKKVPIAAGRQRAEVRDDFDVYKNRSAVTICDEFSRPTLDEMLGKTDDMTVFVEVKYPTVHHKQRCLQYFSRAVLIREILNVVQLHPAKKIAFLSFDPATVVILRNIQTRYPVFFLNLGQGIKDKNTVVYDVNTNQETVWDFERGIDFVLEQKLHGMVTNVKMVQERPNAISKAVGLKINVMTWGTLPGSYLLTVQKNLGIVGIMYDCAQLIDNE